MRIDACFDSHVHWAYTGECAQRLNLSALKSAAEVETLSPLPMHQRGDWLLGFGWDENSWSTLPSREFLDKRFPTTPVSFTRCDGHALWVNSEALRRAGLWTLEDIPMPKGRIERDETGYPNGVLVEDAADLIRKVIPAPSAIEVRRQMLKGMQMFNEAGFTHIRDMTMSEAQWNEAVRMDESGVLTLAVEVYFWLKSLAHINESVSLAIRARGQQTPNLRVKGLKIFFDGALGSEGAYLSRCYHGKSHQGLTLWSKEELEEALRRITEEELEVAVHVIGDAAADEFINVALGVKQKLGKVAAIHLEHCELLQNVTIEKLRTLPVTCHLQPSHWLSDRKWLRQKVGDLYGISFPWRRLQEAEVPFFFGSDAPIEPASIARTLEAIRESANDGIPRLLGQATTYMKHPDLSWAPNSYTILAGDDPHQVVFRGEHLI